jgi:hypothetical protein
MLRWLVLPMIVLAYLTGTTSAGASRDRDHDRLPDRWERRHHLSTTKPSAKRDPDRDRLKNRRELRLRTHPRRADTDRDRLRDGAEIRRFQTNPRKPDTDGDTFRDGCEVRKGTNPRRRRSHPKRRCAKAQQAPPGQPAPGPPAASPNPTGGWPDASNTGVPAGTVLTPAGAMTIDTAGTVIDARAVTGSITVNAPNVTIRRSRIDSDGFDAIRNNSTGLVVEDSEIVDTDGGLMCHNAIRASNYTVQRTEISGCENGAHINSNVVYRDNYVHDLAAPGTGTSQHPDGSPHTDGIQFGAGSNTQVIHNWIDPIPEGRNGTSAIIMQTSGTPNSDVRIEDNYLDARGTSYAVYAPRSHTSNVFINRNRMLRGYGYTGCVRLGVTVAGFSDNRDALSDVLIPPDEGGNVFGSGGGGCTN